MLRVEDVRSLIDQAFEDEALVLGGLLTLHSVDDQFVRRLMQSYAVIRRRTVRACEALGVGKGRSKRGHPAIAEFLREIRRS